jgi:hypothetical protein
MRESPRRGTAIIGFLEVIRAADLTTEHTAAKRRIGDNSNPKLPSGFEKADLLRLDVEAEGRVPGRLCQLRVLLCIMQVQAGYVLDLNSTDVLNLARTSESLGADFREAKVLDLALLFQFLHFANCLLNRSLLIDAMAVIKINTIDAEAAQRLLAGLAAVLGGGISRHSRGGDIILQSKFRG